MQDLLFVGREWGCLNAFGVRGGSQMTYGHGGKSRCSVGATNADVVIGTVKL